MNNPLLLLSPTINVVVTGVFAGVVLRQYLRRRRASQLYWTIALGMAFLATLSYVVMIIMQPASPIGVLLFRLYYILGAALMPAWLGLGSIALITNPRVIRICLIILSILSVLSAVLIFSASIDMQKLSQVAGTPGTGILRPGAWLVTIIGLNTLGVIAVAGVAIYSGWKLLRRQASIAGFHAGNLLWANMLILLGALLDAAAGTFARLLGVESIFWLIMAVGWAVFLAGVLLTGRRSGATRPTGLQQKSTGEQVASSPADHREQPAQ